MNPTTEPGLGTSRIKGPTRARRKRLIAFVASAVVVGSTFWAASTAGASNYSGNTRASGCTALNEADSADHSFYYQDTEQIMVDATNWARTNVYNPTDLSTGVVTSKTDRTDVIVHDGDYNTYCGYDWCCDEGGGVIGLGNCLSTNWWGKCEQHQIRYDNDYTRNVSAWRRQSLACHEMGHTVGLAHRETDTSCMTDKSVTSRYLSAHDKSHINSNY